MGRRRHHGHTGLPGLHLAQAVLDRDSSLGPAFKSFTHDPEKLALGHGLVRGVVNGLDWAIIRAAAHGPKKQRRSP
jgi:hypothetical protein